MTEYEWLPAPAFLTKVKLLPYIPKSADVDRWLKQFNIATRKEKNPERKRKMKIISEELESIKEML